MEAAKALALERVRTRTAPYLLRRWWVRKYSLPPTSDEYLRYTAEGLLVEFFEDYFEDHPDRQVHKEIDEASGQSWFVTGDPLVDRWEREIAAGREPDYDEALTPEQREREETYRRTLARLHAQADGFEGIDERFE